MVTARNCGSGTAAAKVMPAAANQIETILFMQVLSLSLPMLFSILFAFEKKNPMRDPPRKRLGVQVSKPAGSKVSVSVLRWWLSLCDNPAAPSRRRSRIAHGRPRLEELPCGVVSPVAPAPLPRRRAKGFHHANRF